MKGINVDFNTFKKQLIIDLKNKKKVKELKTTAQEVLNTLEFSNFDIARLTGESDINASISSLPPSLPETYYGENLHKEDMSLEYLAHSTVPIFYKDIYDYMAKIPFSSLRLQKNHGTYQLLQDYGYNDIYCVPVTIKTAKTKFLVSIFSKNKAGADFKRQVAIYRTHLDRLAHTLCQLISLPRFIRQSSVNNGNILTPRQIETLEVLTKFAQTHQQAADYLGVSLCTVNKHVEDIKENLGAFSVANSVSLAIGRGLIDPA